MNNYSHNHSKNDENQKIQIAYYEKTALNSLCLLGIILLTQWLLEIFIPMSKVNPIFDVLYFSLLFIFLINIKNFLTNKGKSRGLSVLLNIGILFIGISISITCVNAIFNLCKLLFSLNKFSIAFFENIIINISIVYISILALRVFINPNPTKNKLDRIAKNKKTTNKYNKKNRLKKVEIDKNETIEAVLNNINTLQNLNKYKQTTSIVKEEIIRTKELLDKTTEKERVDYFGKILYSYIPSINSLLCILLEKDTPQQTEIKTLEILLKYSSSLKSFNDKYLDNLYEDKLYVLEEFLKKTDDQSNSVNDNDNFF